LQYQTPIGCYTIGPPPVALFNRRLHASHAASGASDGILGRLTALGMAFPYGILPLKNRHFLPCVIRI